MKTSLNRLLNYLQNPLPGLLLFCAVASSPALAQKDLRVQLLTPVQGQQIVSGQTFQISVRVYNYGSDTIVAADQMSLGIAINNQFIHQQYLVHAQFAPSDSLTVTFDGSLNVINNLQSANFCAGVFIPNTADPTSSNNVSCNQVSLHTTPTAAPADQEQVQVQVYPNPAVHEVVVQSRPGASGRFRIFDTTGRLVKDEPLTEIRLVVPVQELQQGLYMYQALQADGSVQQTGRLVISR